jgi:hypothetical protein
MIISSFLDLPGFQNLEGLRFLKFNNLPGYIILPGLQPDKIDPFRYLLCLPGDRMGPGGIILP